MKVDISDLNKDEILRRAEDEGIEALGENMTKNQLVHWVKCWEKKSKFDELEELVHEVVDNVHSLTVMVEGIKEQLNNNGGAEDFEKLEEGLSNLDAPQAPDDQNERWL